MVELHLHELVLDDVVELRAGAQVVADGEVLVDDNLEIDESLLTGEADAVVKRAGDEVLSGSAVVAGTGRVRVNKVGAENYAAKLADEARRFTLVNSPLRNDVNRIVTWWAWRSSRSACCSRAASSSAATSAGRRPSSARSPGWSAWCPKGSCCSRASRSPSESCGWRSSAAWCRSCRRSRCSPEWTCCAPTRPARSPRAPRAGCRRDGRRRCHARRRRRRARRDGDTRSRSERDRAGARRAIRRAVIVDAQLAHPVQLVAQVELDDLRRVGHRVLGAPENVLGNAWAGELRTAVEGHAADGRRVLVLARAAVRDETLHDVRPVALALFEDVVRATPRTRCATSPTRASP
ncbi:MAG: hypothetical protein R2713_15325 [Ilumatobacteraceae bacterium]